MSRPRKTKAAILVELNKPLVVDEISLPESLGVGQVLVKVHCSGICGSQLGEIGGVKGPDKFLPHLLGHEGTATVIECGPGVETVSPDDLVVMHWRKGSGIEAIPPKYDWNGKTVNAGWVTTFNEYAVISENRLTRIPQDTDKYVAALFGCAVTTGFGVVVNDAQIKIADSVCVYGAGGVGLNIIQAAALSSAYPIIAVDIYDKRLRLAQEMGATHVINSGKEKVAEKINEIIKNNQLDIFIDNTGVPEIIEYGYNTIKPTGKLILVGVPKQGNNISIYSLPMHFGKIIKGSHGGNAMPETDIPKYFNLFSMKNIDLAKLITREYNLDDINIAIDDMRNGTLAGRCMIKF